MGFLILAASTCLVVVRSHHSIYWYQFAHSHRFLFLLKRRFIPLQAKIGSGQAGQIEVMSRSAAVKSVLERNTQRRKPPARSPFWTHIGCIIKLAASSRSYLLYAPCSMLILTLTPAELCKKLADQIEGGVPLERQHGGQRMISRRERCFNNYNKATMVSSSARWSAFSSTYCALVVRELDE